jgi:hypothetical protein
MMRIPAQTYERFRDNLTESKTLGGMGDVAQHKGEVRETNP